MSGLPRVAVEPPHLPSTVAPPSGRQPHVHLVRETRREVAVHGAAILDRLRAPKPAPLPGSAEEDGAGRRVSTRDKTGDKGTNPARAFEPERMGAERVRVDELPAYIGRTRRARRHGKPHVAVYATWDVTGSFIPSGGALPVARAQEVLTVVTKSRGI